MSILRLDGVSKAYRGQTLFSGVDLSLESGSIYGFEGPNGAGKSVLLKIMCRFVRPDQGTVHIDPAFCPAGSTYPNNFGVIIDRPGYVSGLSGIDNLRALARIRDRIGDDEIRAAMRLVGLDPNTPGKVRTYSLGMKQKLALAQAVMEDQQVLILDEPFNALDVDSVENVRGLIDRFRDEGRTIAFTSHNREDMTVLCDEIFRLNAARLERVD